MHWLFLLLALGAMGIALQTASLALMLVSLLASLGLFIAFVMGLYADRVGGTARDDSQMIDPAELRRLREVAEARKASAMRDDTPEPPTVP